MAFNPRRSVQSIKEDILAYIGEIFTQEGLKEEGSPIELQVRDNLPMIEEGKYVRRRATCEFCKEKHDSVTDHCELEVMGLDTRKPEVASKVLLQNVLDQMYWKRTLAFAVIIKNKHNPKWQLLRHLEDDEASSDEEGDSGRGVTLASCFNGYMNLDTLTGDNQYYCKNCKEHKDSSKKLEIYKVPKLMMIQLKRFTTKGSSQNSGKSGFFNLAYA